MFEKSGERRLTSREIPRLPRRIEQILKNQSKVLDVGCGTGWLTNYVGKEAYVGISYSQHEVDNLKKNGYSAFCVNMEKEKLPFKDNSVSCVFASHIIEHFEKSELIHVMNELKRVLKKGGMIILITPTDYSFGFYGEWTHVRPYNHSSLPEMLADFDFTQVDWTYPLLDVIPKFFQRYLRFPLFFLKPVFWKEVIAWGVKS